MQSVREQNPKTYPIWNIRWRTYSLSALQENAAYSKEPNHRGRQERRLDLGRYLRLLLGWWLDFLGTNEAFPRCPPCPCGGAIVLCCYLAVRR